MELFELTEEIEGLFYNKSRNEQWNNALVLIGTILVNADKLDYKKVLNACKEEHEEFIKDFESQNKN
jgi:hypothetical protein